MTNYDVQLPKDTILRINLAWIFKDDIMKKESNFIQNGGKFIIPMPQPHFEP